MTTLDDYRTADEDAPRVPAHLAPVDDERAVLGACMSSPRALDAIVPSVPGPDIFCQPRHGAAWTAIYALWDRGEPVDPQQVFAELGTLGIPDRESGGRPYLHELYASASTGGVLANPMPYLGRVLAGWQLRAGDASLVRGRQTIAAPDGGDPDAILAAVAAEVDHARGLTVRESNAVRVGDVVGDLLDSLDPPPWDEDVPGVPWPYPDLDRLMNPMMPGQLLCVGGRPAMGKTTVLKDICEHVSFHRGLPSLFVTWEEKAPAITARILSHQARVPLTHLTRPGKLDDDDRARIADYRAALEAAPLIIVDGEDTSLPEIDRLVRQYRPRVVAIDYLQMAVPDTGRPEHRRTEVERYTRALKHLASRREIPVVIGSQLNRLSETRRDKRPHLADLRESGGIEQDCHGVILVHRDDYYEPEGPRVGEVDLIVAKQRNGPTDTVTVANRLHFGAFAGMAT